MQRTSVKQNLSSQERNKSTKEPTFEYTYCGKYTETKNLYSDRKHFKLWLGYLDNGLQAQEETVKYKYGFLDKSCKDIHTITSKK